MAERQVLPDLVLNLDDRQVLVGDVPLGRRSDRKFKLLLFLAFRRQTLAPNSSYVSALDLLALPEFRIRKGSNATYLRKFVFDLEREKNALKQVIEKKNDGRLEIRVRLDPPGIRILEKADRLAAPGLIEEFLGISRPVDCSLGELRAVVDVVARADVAQNAGNLRSALHVLSTPDVRSALLQNFLEIKKAKLYDRASDYGSAENIYERLKARWTEGKVLDAAAEAQVFMQEAWLAHRQNNTPRLVRALDNVSAITRRGRIDDLSYAEYLYFTGVREKRLAFKQLASGELARARHHADNALSALKEALFYQIRFLSYDKVQSTAYNIANTLYQLGNEFRKGKAVFDEGGDDGEIKAWLDLTLWIAEAFKVGGDTALAHITYASFLRKRQQNYDDARSMIAFALRKLRRTRNRYERGLAWRQCVYLHKHRGSQLKAMLAFKRALRDFGAAKQPEQLDQLKEAFPDYWKAIDN